MDVVLDQGTTVEAQRQACQNACEEDDKCAKAWYNHQPGIGVSWSWKVIQSNPEHCFLFYNGAGTTIMEDAFKTREVAFYTGFATTFVKDAGKWALFKALGGRMVVVSAATAWCPPCMVVANVGLVAWTAIGIVGMVDTLFFPHCNGVLDKAKNLISRDTCFTKGVKRTSMIRTTPFVACLWQPLQCALGVVAVLSVNVLQQQCSSPLYSVVLYMGIVCCERTHDMLLPACW